MKKAIFATLILVVLFIPAISFAAGIAGPLVPTSGTGGSNASDYNLCDLRVEANNIIDFAVVLSVFVATLMFAYGGILYVTGPAGGEAQIKKAHSVLLNAIVGILIVLLAWLIINIVLSVLTGQGAAFWTQFSCQANPTSASFPAAQQQSQVNGSGTTPTTAVNAPPGSCVATSQALSTQVSATSNCNPAQRVANYGTGTGVVSSIQQNFGSTINQCASEQGIPSSVLVGISGVECAGKSTCNDPSNTSVPCAVGGYGATQVSCSEVRSYCSGSNNAACSGVSGMSNSQLVSTIQSNPTLSFCATAYTMKNDYSQYGNWSYAADDYNGGSGALAPSNSCPGYLVLQCPVASGSSQFPYCNVTCAYNDVFTNYMNAAGGTGMNFNAAFMEYMALAEESQKPNE